MLLLSATTDKLQLVTDAAATVDVHASYAEVNSSTFVTNGLGRQNTAISTATTTDILAAPGASTIRNCKALHIRNKSTTLSVTVTVVFNQNATLYELHKVLLQTGDALEYVEGVGFFTLAPAAKLDLVKYVTADSVHATATTFADVTGLTFPVVSGNVYAFEANLAAITNATTTGAQFGIGGVAMTFMVASGVSSLLGSPTASATFTSGVVQAINTAVMAQTTGAATNQPHFFYGCFQPSASGTFAIRATSEVSVAAGLTILKGSYCHVRQTDN